MFGFLCKRLLPKWRVVGDSANTQLGFIQTTTLPIKSFSSSSSSSSSSENTSSTSVKDELQESFTVTYLIHSCGLSLESAISASKKVHFETPRKPDSVLVFLRDRGFTNTHITKLVRARPRLLMADPEKTLLPKVEFFRSIGVSSTDLAKILSSCPTILAHSLENQLMPWYNFLKSLLLDDKKVIKAMKGSTRILILDVQKNFAPNISVLRQLGVPESLVLLTVTCSATVVLQNRDKFDKIVKEVIEMGFNPEKTEFIQAMQVFSGTSKSTREHKTEVYRRWGWSEDDIRLAFKKYPRIMNISEKKIMSAMNFHVNNMGCQSATIARCPLILHLSLEKRVIPRCSVIKVLLLKGLIMKNLSLGTFLKLTEKQFLDKFVTKYQEDVPQLLNIYQGKMSLLELGFGSEEICGMKEL